MFGSGISQSGDLVDIASENGIIEKAGSWFSYNNQKIGQGRENAKRHLEENPDMAKEIRNKILANSGIVKVTEIDPSEIEAEDEDIDMETGEVVAKTKGKKAKNVQ